MNIISSRIIKSSRPIINRSLETITAYSCEMYIQSFKISYRGFVYFLWSSANSQIHSLRYEANGRLIQVKQTLTISIRITSKNGKEVPLNSHLKLMAETGEELDQFEIHMNTLSSHYREMEIPMNRGLVNIKIRRKIMNIGEEEDINYQRIYRSKVNRYEEKSVAGLVSGEYESLQEELTRTKKDLEDAVYLNNKLKNDRDVLLTTKQELELEIETMIIQITKEISILRQHYDNRMSIREHCYEQEIEDLVNIFNSNADQSKKTVQLILKQKIKLEEELKPLNEKLRKMELDINQHHEDYSNLEREKFQLEIHLNIANQKSQGQGREIELLSNEKGELNVSINSKNIEIQQLSGEIDKLKETLGKQDGSLKAFQQKIFQLELESKAKDKNILQLEEKIAHFQQKQNSLTREKDLLSKEAELLQDEKKTLSAQIESLNGKLQECQYELQFNESVMTQLKNQQAQKQNQLYSQLESLELLCSQKMEDIISSFQHQRQDLLESYKNLQQAKLQYEQRINELQNNLKGSEIQVNSLGNEIKQNQGSIEQKNQRIRMMEEELSKRNAEESGAKYIPQQRLLAQPKYRAQDSPRNEKGEEDLISRNHALSQQIKRLLAIIEENNRQLESLRMRWENQMPRKGDERSQKSSKHSKYMIKDDLEKVFHNGFNQQEVRDIVNKKQRQIRQLRKRVDYLESLYSNLQSIFDEVAKKYQVDLTGIEVGLPKPQEWCDSEQEEEKLLNHALTNNNHVAQTNRIKRADSIGEAIIEKDEDVLSNPSAKLYQRKSFEMRSEPRIKDDYATGVLRRQSLGVGKVTIQVPKDYNSKRDHSYGSYDPSERSGGSYVKVSHSRKIRELEDEIKALMHREQGYQAQIGDYLKSIDALKAENESFKAQLKQTATLKPVKYEKVSKESQVFIEDERVKTFMKESQLKELEVQKMNLRIGELQDNLKKQREEASLKIGALELNLTQNERKLLQITKNYENLSEINKTLQKAIEELELKLRNQKQSVQQMRLSMKQQQIHFDNNLVELKKTKTHNEALEQKIQKMLGNDLIIRQLSKELDDLNKKGLDQIRAINHLKLEKDALEEQLRLVKKRNNDSVRISTQWEEKAASLERAIEQQKRKEGKLKRQIEEGQEELRRFKINIKKVEEQLQISSSAQVTMQAEKRKHLDEITTLQDQISRKDYEYNKLNKQIQKWKMRAEQKDDLRLGKKSELRETIDRLQSELIRRQKKLLEQTEQNKLLRGRLELLQRQNKRIMQQKNQSYGQKLKYYVDEMSNIKKLLEEYQKENSRLKIDNSEFYEQLEILRMNYDKLQMKYDQNIERQQNILNDLQSYMNEVNNLKERLAHSHGELDQTQIAFANLRKEADDYKLHSRKIAEKLDASQRNLERSILQIRDLRIKLSEYETNNEINGKMGERFRLLERKKGELEEQYRKLKSEYENAINLFIYKRQDLEKAVAQARSHEKKLKDEEVQRLNEECVKTITQKTQRLQQEILDIYNENSRIRIQLQSLQEENGRQKGRLSELETTNERFGSLQNEYEVEKCIIDQQKEEIRRKNEKISKLQLSIQGISSECNVKERELLAIRNHVQQLQKTIQRLGNEIESRRKAERQLQDALLAATQAKNRQKSEEEYQFKQRESQIIQQYQAKIHACQLQMQKLKDKEARSCEDYNMKMNKLEVKMDEMQEALKQKEKAIEGHYQSEVQELESSLLRLSQELQEKLIRIDELNDAIIILESENKELAKEAQELKYQFAEERPMFQSELARLKNKLKEAETTYANHLRELEEEILRNAQKGNNSGSRLKPSDAEERVSKRYDEKLKNKDRKIEQLKDNIYNLQETVLKLKKKESSYETTLSQVQKFKLSIIEIQRERKTCESKYEVELNRNADVIRELKREILIIKQNEERLKLVSEEKIFENESITSELNMIRELYHQLQRELEKRKSNLTAQLEEDSHLQLELRSHESKIIQLEGRLMQEMKKSRQFELDSKKKGLEVKKYLEIINESQKKEESYVEENSKLANELTSARKSLMELNTSSESTKTEASKAKAELARLKKSQQELRSTCIIKQEAATELKRLYDQLSSRYKENQQLSRRYIALNDRSRQQLGYELEQAIDRFIIHLEEREGEYNQLVQEIEELKFINQRKYLDYDELKRQNFELHIKVEDMQVLSDQLQSLRKICDKLEEQKKNSVFREEVLRMQLQNLANTIPELRGRIESILLNPSLPSYTNFSFY